MKTKIHNDIRCKEELVKARKKAAERSYKLPHFNCQKTEAGIYAVEWRNHYFEFHACCANSAKAQTITTILRAWCSVFVQLTFPFLEEGEDDVQYEVEETRLVRNIE